MLKGNAYTVGKIIKLFTGKSPLKVLDIEEPLFEKIEPANIRKEEDLWTRKLSIC